MHTRYEYTEQTGVHKFTILHGTMRAVDEVFEQLARIYDEHPKEAWLLFLFDLRPDGTPPFNHTLATAMRFFGQRQQMPRTRVAYIYEKSTLITILRAFFRVVRLSSQRRFFQGDVEEQAIAWLTMHR